MQRVCVPVFSSCSLMCEVCTLPPSWPPPSSRYSRSRSRSYSPYRSYSPRYSRRYRSRSPPRGRDQAGTRVTPEHHYTALSILCVCVCVCVRACACGVVWCGVATIYCHDSPLPQWNPDPSKVLGVFGLSLYTSEREIQDLYSKFGGVERVQVIHDHIVSWEW